MSLEKLKEMLNNDLPDCLYHYTSRDSFIGIMKNKEFWASHIRFMNDLEEERLAEKKLLEQLDIIFKNENKYIVEELKDKVVNAIRNEMNQKGIFIVSLSEENDELNMWRGYGNKIPSYCIELSSEKFVDQFKSELKSNDDEMNAKMLKIFNILNNDELLNDSTFKIWTFEERKQKIYLLPCLYSAEDQNTLMREIIVDSKTYLDRVDGKVTEKSLSEEIAKRFIFYAPIIKDSHFKTEKEWRIVILYEKSVEPKFSKNDLEEKLKNAENESERKRIEHEIEEYEDNLGRLKEDEELLNYRFGNSFIIPYHKFKFNTDCITKVTIGACPDKESVEESTIYFLQQVGFKNADSIVVSSEIPFRCW